MYSTIQTCDEQRANNEEGIVGDWLHSTKATNHPRRCVSRAGGSPRSARFARYPPKPAAIVAPSGSVYATQSVCGGGLRVVRCSWRLDERPNRFLVRRVAPQPRGYAASPALRSGAPTPCAALRDRFGYPPALFVGSTPPGRQSSCSSRFGLVRYQSFWQFESLHSRGSRSPARSAMPVACSAGS